MMLKPQHSRTLLQMAVCAGGFVPVLAGGSGVLHGMVAFDGLGTAWFDSHVRYLSGLLFAIGLAFWSLIPQIETKTVTFRLLTVIVCIGGIGRLVGVIVTGLTSQAILFALMMELVVTPGLCLWQSRLARRSIEIRLP